MDGRAIEVIVCENRFNESIDLCYKSVGESGFILHRIISDLDTDKFREFKKVYKHYSSNSESFELICFRRYFLIYEYLKQNQNIIDFVLIDSDVIVYPFLNKHIEFLRESGYKFSGSILADSEDSASYQISPHVSYWTAAAITDFTEYLLNVYSSDCGLNGLIEIANEFKVSKRRGGVSDMTLLYLWAKKNEYMHPINSVHDYGVVDHNVSTKHGVNRSEFTLGFGGVKKISFTDGVAYFTLADGKKTPALAVHFQGGAKRLMRSVSNKHGFIYSIISVYVSFGKKLKRLFFKVMSAN